MGRAKEMLERLYHVWSDSIIYFSPDDVNAYVMGKVSGLKIAF